MSATLVNLIIQLISGANEARPAGAKNGERCDTALAHARHAKEI